MRSRGGGPLLLVCVFGVAGAFQVPVRRFSECSQNTRGLGLGLRLAASPQQSQTEGESAAVTSDAVEKKTEPPSPVPPSPVRGGPRFGVLGLWVGLILYVAFVAPGKDVASQALDTEMLEKLLADPFAPSVPPVFSWLFNAMGIWPVVMAALLLPGAKDQKVAPWPFLLGSLGLGVFALGPYVALREERTENVQRPTDFIGQRFESKATAGVIALAFIALTYYTAVAVAVDPAGAFADYKTLFDTQLFVHVTTLDFIALWGLSFGILDEDRKRRGGSELTTILFCAVPLAGPILYLLNRPPLPAADTPPSSQMPTIIRRKKKKTGKGKSRDDN